MSFSSNDLLSAKTPLSFISIFTTCLDSLYPCGACRQVICELMNLDAKVTLFRLDKKYKEIKVRDLMPFIFDESELHAK